MKPNRLRKWLTLALYLGLATFVLVLWLRRAIDHNHNKPLLCFHTMVTGQAPCPFVRRQLLPPTIRGINSALPGPWRQSLTRMAQENQRLAGIFARNPIDPEYFSEYIIAAVLLLACLVGFAYAIRLLFLRLYSGSALAADLLPVFALLWLPITFREANLAYLYDFPTLLLFTLSLYLISSQNWSIFYLVFALGCLNKETFILITLIFAWHYLGQMRRTKLLGHLATQVAIFAVIQGTLYWSFQHNPGGQLETHLLGHNLYVFRHLPYDIISVLAVFVLLGGLFYDWQHKPRLLKCGLGVLVLVLPLVVVFAWIDELRAYYEFFPVIMLLLFHTFSKYAWDESLRSRESTTSKPAGIANLT